MSIKLLSGNSTVG